MYNDPNAQQPPYEQPPYTSYEQQYGQQPQAAPPGGQSQYGIPLYTPSEYAAPPTPPPYAPNPYEAPPTYPPPVYMPPPQPQPQSNKTLWIVLGIVGGVLVLIIGLCSASVYFAGRAVSNVSQTFQATTTAIQQTSVADEPPPQQQAENYYLAISVQDYTGAYNYLASNANGSTLTATTFTQQAQARDSSDGDVADYTATADPNDDTKVTVQVTRAGTNGTPETYTAHLTFTQGDFQWVISSFDTI